MRLSDHPAIFHPTPAQRAVMSGGPSLSMNPDNAALDRVAADGHPVIGRAPGPPGPGAGTLPGSDLSAAALANAAAAAARAKAAGVTIPTRDEAAAMQAGTSTPCPSCEKRTARAARARKRLSGI